MRYSEVSFRSQHKFTKMDRTLAILGLLSCFILGGQAAETVTVSRDITVKATPEPLSNPADKVDVTLNCTGSRSDLSFYIKNSVLWDFIKPDGTKYAITKAFYQDPKSEYAANHFTTGHFTFLYVQDSSSRYVFSLSIHGVTRADDGIYRCSLQNDIKEVKLTVVNPVEKVSLEIHDAQHNVIQRSMSPVTTASTPVKLTPGQYMVKCDASGSNPEPVMKLMLNDMLPYVAVKTMKDTSSEFTSYKGTYTVESLTINAHDAPQTLVCQANIGGDYFPESATAGIALMVTIDKPTIACANATASLGDRNTKIMCQVSAGANSGSLTCDKLSWLLSTKGQKITYDQRWKDPERTYDIIESTCEGPKGSEGITMTLTLYTVNKELFMETFFLVYSAGGSTHRKPVTLYDVTVAGAGIATPLSVLACLVMAFLSKHLASL